MIWHLVYNAVRDPPDRTKFRQLLSKWQQKHGRLERLVTEPQMHEPPPEWTEPDIYDYGVERLLIVQHDLLVDLLVKNGVHAEQRALILAESGYPYYLFPLAVKALRENPELPIYLLHDATTAGGDLASRLQDIEYLECEGHPQIDLGLFPENVKRINKLKVLRPQKSDYQIPVDALPFATLSLGLAEGLAAQMTLGELLAARDVTGGGGNAEASFG